LQPRHPSLVTAFLEARTIYESGSTKGTLDDAEIDRLLELARSPRSPIGENVATMIGELSSRIPSVERCIRVLASGKLRHERINAIVALSVAPASDLHGKLLQALLTDKVASIRALAADKIVFHRIDHLVPALAEAARRETHAATAAELRQCLDLLRQRFHIERRPDSVWVTCCPTEGGRVGRLFSLESYEAAGRAWIAETLGPQPHEA
jgi:hypothetical protein